MEKLVLAAIAEYWSRSSDAVFVKDLNGVFVSVTKPFAELYGRDEPGEIVGRTVAELVSDPELAKRYAEDDARLLADGAPRENYIEPAPFAHGRARYCVTSKYVLRSESGGPAGILGVCRDVTSDYGAQRDFMRLPEDAIQGAMLDVADWRVVDFVRRADTGSILSEYVTADEYILSEANAASLDARAEAYYRGLSRESLAKRYEAQERGEMIEYERIMPNGAKLWVCAQTRLAPDPVTGNLTLVIILRDIEERRRDYTQLLREAEIDSMTGLFNRAAMLRRIEAYISGDGQAGTHALFMIDLDNFKLFNDSFGHQCGDRMLADAAHAIKSAFRATDIVARIGGDEFMALMKNAGGEGIVRRKADALLSSLQFSATDGEKKLDLTSSVGVTIFTPGERDFARLYQEADSALYKSKDGGRNRYSLFGREDCPLPSGEEHRSVDTVHLNTLLEYMDGGVILSEIGNDIRVTYVSPSFYRTFGRDKSDGTDDVFSVVYPDDLPGLRAALFQAARENELLDYSYRARTDDGLEWRHIRAKRIPDDREGSAARMVAVITDITFFKRTEEHLRETETRYRNAIEQTETMLWEVDIKSRSLSLIGQAWDKLGVSVREFCRAPDDYLALGKIFKSSQADFRRIFDDIYAGREPGSYYIKTSDAAGEGTWVSSHYSYLRDESGEPYRALGVTSLVPNIDAEMRLFEQELRFAGIVRSSLAGYVRANFTLDRVERAEMNDDSEYSRYEGASFDEYLCEVAKKFVSPEDAERFLGELSRDVLISRFRAGEVWKSLDYRREFAGTLFRWTSVFVKLMRHPVSGDVLAFCYLRDDEAPHAWEEGLGAPLGRNATRVLYSPESMGALARHALSTSRSLAAVSVIELSGLDRVRRERGALEASELLLTFGRLCRIVVSGNVAIGQLDENRVIMLRLDAVGVERQRERVASAIKLLKEFISQAYPEARISVIGGFAVGGPGRANYDQLLRNASIACQSASQAMDESTVAYADTGTEAESTTDVEARYQLLQLRYQQQANLLRQMENDGLTGLLGPRAFYERVRERLTGAGEKFAILRFDINRFKVYNDVRGVRAGDALLRDIASLLRLMDGGRMLTARLESDHFVALIPDSEPAVRRFADDFARWLNEYSQDYRLSFTVGVYRVIDARMEVSIMCDRALLALRSVKTGFETRVAYYDEGLREALIDEQQLVDDLDQAMAENQFEVFYQPQIDYEDGSVVGAEALARWRHPERGLLVPASFIPLFEKNGLITRLDEYVWRSACRRAREWADKNPGRAVTPVSVNVSRIDIYNARLTETLLRIVGESGLSPESIKLEITESAYMDNPNQLISTVSKLRRAGFTVEMDDFGAGYSSLNILKDVPVDVLKLDMKFLADCADTARGGNILSSIIRMAHWLKIPVIAEGVETRAQADYLKSLGCVYMQGYCFARPMPADEFYELISGRDSGRLDKYEGARLEEAAAFWDPSAQTALLFNSLVGGAAIIEYEDGSVSVLRANDRFYAELNTTRTEHLPRQSHVLDGFDEENATVYRRMLENAMLTGGEAECRLRCLAPRPGADDFFIHNRVRPLAHSGRTWLFYLAVENVSGRDNS